jgi:hypothetical protein
MMRRRFSKEDRVIRLGEGMYFTVFSPDYLQGFYSSEEEYSLQEPMLSKAIAIAIKMGIVGPNAQHRWKLTEYGKAYSALMQ